MSEAELARFWESKDGVSAWASLEVGLLAAVAGKLQAQDVCALRAMRQVNTSWRQGVTEGVVFLRPEKGWNDNTVQKVARVLPKIQELDLSRCARNWRGGKLTQRGLQDIQLLRDLRRLSLPCSSGMCSFPGMSALTRLTVLTLSDIEHVTDLARLKMLTGLRELSFMSCQKLTDDNMRALLPRLLHLEVLSLRHSEQLSNAALAAIGACSRLHTLDLDGGRGFSDVGLLHIVQLPRLTSLDLHCSRWLCDDGLQHIGKALCLQKLSLGYCLGITDAGLLHLSQLHGLTELSLRCCPLITDLGLMSVTRSVRSLNSLDVRNCRCITDTACTKCICKLTSLTSLDLSYCVGISLSGVRCLKALEHLQHLALSLCPQFDEAEAHKELGSLAAVACSKSQERVLPVRKRKGIKHHRSLEAG